jgi:hypothetical protein
VQPQKGGSILRTQGSVWVNGYEARDSSAVFPGDLLETKAGASANLSLEGTTILLEPETVAQLGANLLELDHGSVSVGTSKSFKVKVNCLTAIPVLTEWTQYEVANLSGNIQVAARKSNVNVERAGIKEAAHKKPIAGTGTSSGSTVHETEQKSFDQSELCGTPRPQGAGASPNTKWIAAGAAGGTGVLLCVLLCGGSSSKTPISSSAP